MWFFKNCLVKEHFMWGHPSCLHFLPFFPNRVSRLGVFMPLARWAHLGQAASSAKGEMKSVLFPSRLMGPCGSRFGKFLRKQMRIARLGRDEFRKHAFGLSGLKVSGGFWLFLSRVAGLAVQRHPQGSFFSSLR